MAGHGSAPIRDRLLRRPQVGSRHPDRPIDPQSCDFEKGRRTGFSKGGQRYFWTAKLSYSSGDSTFASISRALQVPAEKASADVPDQIACSPGFAAMPLLSADAPKLSQAKPRGSQGRAHGKNGSTARATAGVETISPPAFVATIFLSLLRPRDVAGVRNRAR